MSFNFFVHSPRLKKYCNGSKKLFCAFGHNKHELGVLRYTNVNAKKYFMCAMLTLFLFMYIFFVVLDNENHLS